MADDVIRVSGLFKEYTTPAGPFPVLKDVNLRIGPGEFVAIMGPSGSGKSTFMNILGCLDRPTAGEYALDGRAVSGMDKDELARVRNRTIGFVFQGFNLLPRFSLADNVALPLVYGGVDHAAQRRRALVQLERVGLGRYADSLPSRISGGQQQRVAIARALVNEPRLILADEPTGNLDTQTSEEIMALFTALNDEGITIVLVTHEPDIAHHAKRLVRFRDGRIVQDGDAKALLHFDDPAHESTQGLERAFLPFQGGGQEGDGVTSSADSLKPHPHPGPPPFDYAQDRLEGEGESARPPVLGDAGSGKEAGA